jgi:hypothetical protein
VEGEDEKLTTGGGSGLGRSQEPASWSFTVFLSQDGTFDIFFVVGRGDWAGASGWFLAPGRMVE